MNKTISIILVAIFATQLVTSQKMVAEINMKRVHTIMEFTSPSTDVVVLFKPSMKSLDEILTTTFTITIHNLWMDYSKGLKCDDDDLGVPTYTQEYEPNNITNNTIKFTGFNFASLEGKSVRLKVQGSSNTVYCAAIWKEGKYQTAVATFSGDVFGSVFFRQQDSTDGIYLLSELVSDLYFPNPKWQIISNDIKSCDIALLFTNVFKDLNDIMGSPSISNTSEQSKSPFSSFNLPLTDNSDGILNKHIVIFDQVDKTKSACAKIIPFKPRKATAHFSHEGIRGDIKFAQESPWDKTQTSVNLRGLNSDANGYHIHLYPVPIQTEKGQALCSAAVVAGHFDPFGIGTSPVSATVDFTPDLCEVGDLSCKYGFFNGTNELSENYRHDWNLPMFGKNSIVGRSIVIHKAGSNDRWVCSNIELDDDLVAAVAVFKYPVYGRIYFTQAEDMPFSDTWIFANDLTYLDDNQQLQLSDNLKWHIRTNKVGDDMIASQSRCSSTGQRFDPFGNATCNGDDLSKSCNAGDMSEKHGLLQMSTEPVNKAYFTDSLLPLSGKNSIIGRSVVIMNKEDSSILACATIERLHKPHMKADLSLGSMDFGTVTFTQQPGFGLRQTKVSVGNSGTGTNQLQIRSLTPIDGKKPCSDVGLIYNPLEVSGMSATETDDQYLLGDLSRVKSSRTDLNLPMTGMTSIRHRTLAVVNPQGDVLSCGLIQDPFSRTFGGYRVAARVVFGDPLSGTIDLFQTLRHDGTLSDTSVVISLRNVDNTKTQNHNWHVHVKPVSGDAAATTQRCTSTGPHYDPFMAKIASMATKYSQNCKKSNPLRCELGDQASKLGTYSLGEGRMVYTDIDLPLNGMNKVQGRSIVVHTANKGAPRYSCADINPVSALYITVKFKTPRNLDLQNVALVYSQAINVTANEVVVEFVTSSSENTEVKVYFLGLKRQIFQAKFLVHYKSGGSFANYAPEYVKASNDKNKAGVVTISKVLLLMAIVIYGGATHSMG